ncbi:PDC sensor domain-containing protein [Aquiflexum sp. TKW24L]|uniref:PDC sensor domain-containing protein n=1 Tax=Aquiflexum sp. TKW24L TaxID=2942212 RepID=UPI0020BE2FA1|nr:PDC sensor domain-containing protein [Aquiflexum sp. TKW24L]MCL6259595.1 PDC sensor domain-containing protein [Aquiflexum sp. TKW24L]
MKVLLILLFFAFIGFASCKPSPEKERQANFFEINTFVSLLEYDLGLLEEEIIKLGKVSQELLENPTLSTSVLSDQNFDLTGVSSNSEPGADPEKSSLYFPTSGKDKLAVREMILLTTPLDEEFKKVVKKFPTVSQVYFNSKIQLNRLFPPYDVNTMLEPDLDVTKFNFYYKGDEKNNPSKGPVWIEEMYIDPVGRGWMVTLTQPVYVDGDLKMVLGFDITLNDIIENYINKSKKELIIVDRKGTVVAGKTKAIEALALPSLKNYTYTQTITSDSYRKEDFNLFKSKDKNVRALADKIINSNEEELWLSENKTKLKILSKKMDKLDWYVLEIQF